MKMEDRRQKTEDGRRLPVRIRLRRRRRGGRRLPAGKAGTVDGRRWMGKLIAAICLQIVLFSFLSCGPEIPRSINLEYNGNGLVLFMPGYISTPLYERDMAISPSDDEIVYTLGNHRQTVRALVMIKRSGSDWGSKEILPFSGRYSDIEPFFSADGQTLYFASNRPIYGDTTRTDYNIWKVKRLLDGWGEASPLDSIINTRGEEYYPSLGKSGNLYFTASREDGIGREDIFMSEYDKGKYKEPLVLDSTINTASFEFNAYIHPDENLLIFSSFGRDDGFGGGDLYYSLKDAQGNWSQAINMGEKINSESLDFCPFVDVERGVFYFTSDRAIEHSVQLNTVEELEDEADRILNGMGNIYRIPLSRLEIE